MKTTTLTKEEFITRSMAGEVFIFECNRYFYDTNEEIPFRYNRNPLKNFWFHFDGIRIFIIEEPKPIMERRWKWRKDFSSGVTKESDYISDKYAEFNSCAEFNWYKVEDLYIDV